MSKKYHVRTNGVFFRDFDDEQAMRMFISRQEFPDNWTVYIRLDPEDNEPVTPEWLGATFKKSVYPGTWDFGGGYLEMIGNSCLIGNAVTDCIGFASKRGQLLRLVKALKELDS